MFYSDVNLPFASHVLMLFFRQQIEFNVVNVPSMRSHWIPVLYNKEYIKVILLKTLLI